MSFLNSLRMCTCWYGLLELLLLKHAAGQIWFTSKYDRKTVTGIVGLSVNFTWSFSGDVLSVSWGLRKKDGVIGFENNGVLVSLDKKGPVSVAVPSAYTARVSGSGDASSGQVIFTLSQIKSSDQGFYGCRIDPTDGFYAQKFDSVYLAVNEAPQVSIFSVKANYNEGSSVNIGCTASGTPEPDVQWIRNGKVKSSGKKTSLLTFSRIKRADLGQYTCRANSSAGNDQKTVRIVIHYSPTIKESFSSNNKSWIGQTVTLTCVSDGVPTPTLTWYKPDGNQINRVTAEKNTVNVTMYVDQDFGGYKCYADNELPCADFKIVNIQQITKPGSPATAKLHAQVTSLAVKWTVPADDGGSPITAYRVVVLKGVAEISNTNVTDPCTTSWNVEGLVRATKYTVKVLARNAVFEGPAVKRVVKTKYGVSPKLIKKSKSEVTVVEGNVLYLVCETEGYPMPSVYWKKNGRVLQANVMISKTDFIIDDTSEQDAGKYECEAINSIGTVSYTVKVVIQESGMCRENACDERTLHIIYIIVILMLLIILILIVVQRKLRNGAATLDTNRRKKCAERGGECVVLNPIAVKPDRQSSSNTVSSDSKTYAAPSREDFMPLHASARTWEINREQVKIIKVFGKGAFSRVAKATAWNINGNEENTTVAVKMLKANAPESDRRDLLSELELMKTLKPHPHVIKLMGCVTETDPLLVLIEYVPYGDLLGYLRKSRGLDDTYFKDPDVKPQTSLTAEQLIRFAWQVADGMLFLSSRKIIHRDLAARNVLVGEGEKCKVTDFGMARNVQQDDIYNKQSRGRLPVKWTAYEALLYGTYTTQSDVWSYGVLLYEIFTVGGSPYPGIDARQIAKKLQDGFRMPKPKHVDNKLYQIMLKCWEENPSDRPTFANLKNTMKEMERNHRTYINLKQYMQEQLVYKC